ncbi:MAG: hypothetical protein KatS3mg059_1363 [Thermomicrobiales bacterium]|nr:MAG: hypothetical protein KatS3mg059_1363 [Thermomicrobiales bacterium]
MRLRYSLSSRLLTDAWYAGRTPAVIADCQCNATVGEPADWSAMLPLARGERLRFPKTTWLITSLGKSGSSRDQWCGHSSRTCAEADALAGPASVKWRSAADELTEWRAAIFRKPVPR